jgi:hypothetical protein
LMGIRKVGVARNACMLACLYACVSWLWKPLCIEAVKSKQKTICVCFFLSSSVYDHVIGWEKLGMCNKSNHSTCTCTFREQGVAIGQALMYAGYIEPIGNQFPIFRDDFTVYKPGEVNVSIL